MILISPLIGVLIFSFLYGLFFFIYRFWRFPEEKLSCHEKTLKASQDFFAYASAPITLWISYKCFEKAFNINEVEFVWPAILLFVIGVSTLILGTEVFTGLNKVIEKYSK